MLIERVLCRTDVCDLHIDNIARSSAVQSRGLVAERDDVLDPQHIVEPRWNSRTEAIVWDYDGTLKIF